MDIGCERFRETVSDYLLLVALLELIGLETKYSHPFFDLSQTVHLTFAQSHISLYHAVNTWDVRSVGTVFSHIDTKTSVLQVLNTMLSRVRLNPGGCAASITGIGTTSVNS